LNVVLEYKVADALSVYHHVYEPNVPLMRFLKDSSTPIPSPLYASGRFVVNSQLKEELGRKEIDYEKITSLLRDADLAGISLDAEILEYTLRNNLEEKGEAFEQNPEEHLLLEAVANGIDLVYALPFDVNLRKLQNIHYALKNSVYPDYRKKADQGDKDFASWVALFETVCKRLNLKTA
jgi:hypothetical protein